jgi:hypothetical protein
MKSKRVGGTVEEKESVDGDSSLMTGCAAEGLIYNFTV